MAIISNAVTIADAGAFSVGLGAMTLIKTLTASSSANLTFVHGSSSVVLDKFIYSIGIRHIGQENAKLLSRHLKSVENFFKLVDKKKIILPKFDCFAYGFPCNDFSNVGESLGIKGKFGPLYTYGVELIERYNPTWFVAENVGGIKSSNEGKTFIKILKDLDFHEYKISVKASDVLLTVEAYKQLAKETKAPLHLGVTEAGGLMTGSIKSSIGIGQLLMLGIGDTIRVSLSANPVEEIKVGFNILKSLGLRYRGVTIISCPSCARQGFEVIDTVKVLEEKLSHITESITLSVIGCVVNGPGEALYTDVGFTGGGKDSGMIYISGKQLSKLDNKDMVEKIVEHVEEKARSIVKEEKNDSYSTR